MQKNTYFFILCLFSSSVVFAQLSGRVIDSQTYTALEGATILSNTDMLITSNPEGYFIFPGETENIKDLTFSFVGYKTKIIEITEKKTIINVTLEPEPQTIRELVVKVSGFSESLLKSTGSVSSLSQQKLLTHNGIILNDAVNTVPGVYMSSGGYNTNRLTIRGIGSRSLYSSNRIRAYLDDIPLTSGDGVTSIEDIDMAAISRIEILKGPSSAVYGSGLGGTVRIWPYHPVDEKFSVSLNEEISSYGTFRSSIKSGFKTDQGSISLVYSNSHTDGFRQNSQYTRNSLLFSSSRNFGKTNIILTLLYTGLDAGIPSSLTWDDFTTDPSLAAPNWLAVKGFEKYKRLLYGLTIETKLNQGLSNKISVFGSLFDLYESRPFNILEQKSGSVGLKEQIILTKWKIELQAGAETSLEGFKWKTFETIAGEKGNLFSDNHEKRFYLNTFILSRYKSGKRLTAELGLNVNILNYSLEDAYTFDTLDLSGDYTYDPVFSPRIAINYRLDSELNLHSSLGHGFSAPSLEETLLSDGQINTGLKPETGWNYDIGIRGKAIAGRISYDFTIYYIALSNLLVTQRVSEDVFTGINAGETNHAGIESMLLIDLLSPEIRDKTELTLSSSFSASINRFKDFSDNNTDYSGNKLPGIPSSMLVNELKLKVFRNIEFTGIHKFTGKQYLNDVNSKDYENWQTVDLRLSYVKQFGRKQHQMRFYGGVKNLFNKNYAGMILVNAPSFAGSEPRYYYPGLPGNYYAGIILEFK
jgi:iron complex outermembrane receptor protein